MTFTTVYSAICHIQCLIFLTQLLERKVTAIITSIIMIDRRIAIQLTHSQTTSPTTIIAISLIHIILIVRACVTTLLIK